MGTRTLAIAFDCPLALAEVRSRLRQLTAWAWCERENDRYGDYLWTSLPGEGKIRLIEERDCFVFDLEFQAQDRDIEARFDQVLADLRERVAPALGATRTWTVDGYGR